jgi:uncharacterized protein YidB (DUF937 family)
MAMEEAMGVLDSLIGGDVTAELVNAVNGFIQKQGGVNGLINQFEKQGLGPIIRSWVGTGENHPISPAQIQRALGYETLQQLGAEVGMSPDDMAAKLSDILPKAIDKLTPRGTESAALKQRRRNWF